MFSFSVYQCVLCVYVFGDAWHFKVYSTFAATISFKLNWFGIRVVFTIDSLVITIIAGHGGVVVGSVPWNRMVPGSNPPQTATYGP